MIDLLWGCPRKPVAVSKQVSLFLNQAFTNSSIVAGIYNRIDPVIDPKSANKDSAAARQ